MDKYDLNIFLKDLKYISKDIIIKKIKNGDLSPENIADIMLRYDRKLRAIEKISYLYHDLGYCDEEEE